MTDLSPKALYETANFPSCSVQTATRLSSVQDLSLNHSMRTSFLRYESPALSVSVYVYSEKEVARDVIDDSVERIWYSITSPMEPVAVCA